MKHLKNFKVFENSKFYNPSSETLKKLEYWIEKKITTNPELKLDSWIYSNIIRKKGEESSIELQKWVIDNSNKFKSFCDKILNTYSVNNYLIQAGQDPQNEWVGFNFNRNLKNKETSTSSTKLTYNLYITFQESEENFKKWINSISNLISRFYSSCKDGELKESAISLKFGYELKHYINDKDHLKFYWYKKEDEKIIEKIVSDWLKENNIETLDRPYSKGVDPEVGGSKSSWGVKVSEEVNKAFEDLLIQHIQAGIGNDNGNKFSAKQYADWIVNMLNTTKFKF
jgi:hypothetical protein